MTQVALVAFSAGPHRYALEACQVRALAAQPDGERHKAASAWLGPLVENSAPTRWLTLADHQGLWQLGVEGSVELIDWPADALYPLPPLVRARAFTRALCGVAIDENGTALWLLDAAKLSPL